MIVYGLEWYFTKNCEMLECHVNPASESTCERKFKIALINIPL